MVEFFGKSQSHVIKIAPVNSISHDQIYKFTLISYVPFLAITSSLMYSKDYWNLQFGCR